jgi:hypothetical protein
MKLNTPTINSDQDSLPFVLFAQGVILIAFSCLSYFRQEMPSVLFYMSLDVAIIVCFVVYRVFESRHIANTLLVVTLVVGFVYAILILVDPPSLIWCLTALPILIGICGYPGNLYLSASLFGIAALVLFQEASIDQSNTLSVSTTLQFLFMILVVTIIGSTANNFRLKCLAMTAFLVAGTETHLLSSFLTAMPRQRY